MGSFIPLLGPVCRTAPAADKSAWGKVEVACGVPLVAEFGPDTRAAQGQDRGARAPSHDHPNAPKRCHNSTFFWCCRQQNPPPPPPSPPRPSATARRCPPPLKE
eukprot:gene17270-biopygen23332